MKSKLIFLLMLLVAVFTLSGCNDKASDAWPGYIEGDYIDVTPEVSGKLKQLFVSKGQKVQQGDVLFALEENPERLQVTELQARVAAQHHKIKDIQAQLTLSQQSLARSERLAKIDLSSLSDLDAARAKQASSKAQLAANKDELEAQEALLAKASWLLSRKQQVASATGYIDDIWFNTGEWVPLGKPVIRLRPTDGLIIRFFVPESELASIVMGSQVMVNSDGQQPFLATVEAIASEPEFTPPVLYSDKARDKLMFWVEARPNHKDNLTLHPGMPVDVITQ